MFSTPKPAFGQSTGTFGGFNASNATSPFGQNTFGKPATTGFASTSTFGSPTTGSNLFGASSSTSGGMFGQPANQTGFGFSQNTSGGIFGSTPAVGGTSMFGQTPATQTFGTKPTGFGTFGTSSTAPVGGLFGSNNQMGTGMFGQPSTATASNTGLFGNTSGFGSSTQTGTYIKFAPVNGTDVLIKNGQPQNINTQHHCITSMKEYENKSLEELRYEDYLANRKGNASTGLFGSATPAVGNTFGQPSTSNTMFGQPAQDKPLFGQTNTTFGQSPGGVFGKPQTTGFGAQPVTSNNTFAFGSPTTNQTSSFFGAAKPFGSAATPAFSTPTQGNTFRPTQPTTFSGFGNVQQPVSIFGSKPPENTGFGMPQTSTAPGFGAFGAPQDSLFGAKPAVSGFGTTPPVFGTGNTFGAATSSVATGTAFPSFGAKPPETGTTGFGGFNTTSATNPGLGTNLNLGGGGLFAPKPAGGGIFGTTTNQQQPGLFGNTGGLQMSGGLGGNLGTGTFNTGTSNFSTGTTGLGGFGSTGLGNTNTWGASSLGGGLNLGGNTLGANTNTGALGNVAGANAGSGVHDRIINLARACPYGYSSLLKDISPTSDKCDDVLKPTNPAAQRAIMESDKYKVTLGVTKLKVKPLHVISKKSLFDGLEEDDPSIQKFTLEPNVKRLVLRPKPSSNIDTSTLEMSTNEGVQDQHNNSLNDNSVIIVDNPRRSFTPPRDVISTEENSNNEIQRFSPSNIQKRIGLENPRGGILKNSHNLSLSDSMNIEDSHDKRRSSWLTTKPLVRFPNEKQIRSLDNTVEQLLSSKNSPLNPMEKDQEPHRNIYPNLSEISEFRNLRESRSGLLDAEDKENIANPVLNDDDDIGLLDVQTNMPPHPTGIKLTRSGYYTLPSLDDLTAYMKPDGKCIVPQFTIGRRGYGNVFFDCEIDVANLDIDQLVHIMNKEIIIYPDDDAKPPIGEGLNRPAQVTLDCVWPIDKTLKEPITQPEKLAKMDYDGKLRRVCIKHNTRFIEYRPQTGSWVFKVPHFSKYGLTNSDEEDEGQPDVPKKTTKLIEVPTKLNVVSKEIPSHSVLLGTGGLVAENISNVINERFSFANDNEHTLDSASVDVPFLSKINGAAKGLAMDTSEENSMDSTALYPEVGQTSFYAAKDAMSPTSQIARFENRNSHTLQLMKASFFNTDTEMDDTASVTDQLVPQLSIPHSPLSTVTLVAQSESSMSVVQKKMDVPIQTGLYIQPPIVKPKSVVLKYHKRVLPYKKSIAGRFGKGNYADMSIALARLLHVGWGPTSQLITLTTADMATDIPTNSNLLTLSSLVNGRKSEDTSRQLTLHLQIAGGGPPNATNFKNTIENFMKTCLKYSEIEKINNEDENCPYIYPKTCQIEAVKEYIQEANRLDSLNNSTDYGVSFLYWKEVWTLCLALWGEHGDPEIDPNLPSGCRLLGQNLALSEWLQTVSSPQPDEEVTIFTLLASRRIREACQLAHKKNDHFMALILSQIGGELRVRNLATRQLNLWKETNADQMIDSVRLITYGLLAGRSRIIVNSEKNNGPTSLHVCNGLDWIRAFGLHFWYICEPVATVSDAIQAYKQSFFEEAQLRKRGNDFINTNPAENEENDDYDLTTAESHDVLHGRVAFPSPPYENNNDDFEDVSVKKRVLDLRYQLMTLRASRWHSIDSLLNPASHTPDPLDHRLSWLLQQFLQGIGYSHWSERGLHNIVTGFASQLQAHGLWYWSIFVLQHVKDTVLRNHLVKEVVLRYAGGSENTPSRDLLEQLKIPNKWIYEAEALKAKYEGDGESEAHYLTLSGHYAEAHKVIIDQLAPTTILNENPEALRRLLKPLASVGDAGRIPDWNTGGHLLLEFLDICDEVNLIKDGDCDSLSYQCESLRMRLASACSAVTKFPTPTLKHTVARCEIGARLASIGCAIAGLDSNITRSNISPLLSLLNRMDLPSDYIRKLLDKISDSLTEESGLIFNSDAMSDSSEE